MTNDFIAKRNNRQQNTRREQLSPQEWAEKKQLEKESVYQLIDSTAEEISENPDKLKVVGDAAVYEELGFAVHKGNSELLDKINKGLNNLKENGKYDELLKKWELI